MSSNKQHLTRATLLLRIRDPRDGAAWAQFARVYVPMVHRYCLRRGLQDADATDVSQEVLKAVSGAIPKFKYDPAHGSFRDWLFVVVRSKLNDFFDRQRRRERGSGRTSMQQVLNEQPAAQESSDWNEDCRRELLEWAVKEARKEFESRTWRAFIMVAVQGRTAKETAAATGLSTNAIYIARSRVQARLRELAADVADGEPPI